MPTEYHFLSGEVMPTNQFSVTEYYQKMKPTDRSYPGMSGLYNLSNLCMVKFTDVDCMVHTVKLNWFFFASLHPSVETA